MSQKLNHLINLRSEELFEKKKKSVSSISTVSLNCTVADTNLIYKYLDPAW